MLCVVSNKNAAVSGYQSAADNANGTAPRSKNIFVGYLILEMPSDSQSEKGKNYISDMLHCVKLDSVVMPCTAVSFHVLTFNQLELRRLQRLQSDKTWPALSLEQLLFSFGGSGKWRRNSLLSIYGARPMNMECIFMLIAVFPAKCLCKWGGKRAAQTHIPVLQSESEQRRTGGNMGRDFLPRGCMSLEVSCQTFCSEFFLQHLLLLFFYMQHSSSRWGGRWLDCIHPKVWYVSAVLVGVPVRWVAEHLQRQLALLYAAWGVG